MSEAISKMLGFKDVNEAVGFDPQEMIIHQVDKTLAINSNFKEGDILVLSRTKLPQSHDLTVCKINGEFCVRRINKTLDGIYIVPQSGTGAAVKVNNDASLEIWGVVSHIILKA